RLGLNLDLNENTGGCSPRVVQKLASLQATEIALYPDREAGERLVARFFRVTPEQVLLTNGADEALQMFAQTYLSEGAEVVVTDPTLHVYPIGGGGAGPNLVAVRSDADFSFPLDKVLNAVTARTKMILLANPNNPTATVVPRADLIRVIESAPNAAVLIDE